jgi:hypothetical protein
VIPIANEAGIVSVPAPRASVFIWSRSFKQVFASARDPSLPRPRSVGIKVQDILAQRNDHPIELSILCAIGLK